MTVQSTGTGSRNSRDISSLIFTVLLVCWVFGFPVVAKTVSKQAITTPKEALGFNIGDDYQMASYAQLEAYWKKLAGQSSRMKLVDIGLTAEHRHQYMAIISSPENLKHLEEWKQISSRLAHASGLTDDDAKELARKGKAVVWIDGGLHANETVGSQQLMEHVYQMLTRNDAETMRFLDDTVQLCVPANPDGQDLVAGWYMRETNPEKRTLQYLPKLFQHYIGHDNNRDFYISNMPETTNMNRQLFHEWFPQIVYNHHQTGPAGAVIFMPPFRDPFNYHFDPLVPLGVEAVGTAMHERLVAEGKGGSAQRTGANYSTWWNGGLRTVTYFHNMIGLLTEIIGNPTPMAIPLVANKQLPTGDWPLPIAPQTWHYRQSIDYDVTNNRAVLDYASRNRETLLYNIYLMGRNSIRNGSEDHWTITPDRIDALRAAANGKVGESARLAVELFAKVLHDPKARDPRVYLIPSDQYDFATATEFINALIKTGIAVEKATAPFEAGGKAYPAGSYVVRAAQAFRPHVLDMFEPQHHPNDFQYPGGPPVPPYDSAGWTLALQMGVQFDRLYENFNGPLSAVNGIQAPPSYGINGPANPAGYLLSHRVNNSFIAINRLLKANHSVFWMQNSGPADGHNLGSGVIWIPEASGVRSILESAAQKLGVPVYSSSQAPLGRALKLRPIRIGLYDQYGGLITSGWDRWLFEQYEFPFEAIHPQTIDAGHLRDKFDVLLFTDGAYRETSEGSEEFNRQPKPEEIPAEYRPWLGTITAAKTLPAVKAFLEAGGSVVTVGSSTAMASALGVSAASYLQQMGTDGKLHRLPSDKFYIPGSLLSMELDNTQPIAYGMNDRSIVFFDNSPVFRWTPDAELEPLQPVGWFGTASPLVSGWAWGQQYLNGGIGVATAAVGQGTLALLGPEVTFRAQPHGTFKLLFNSIYYGTAQKVAAVTD